MIITQSAISDGCIKIPPFMYLLQAKLVICPLKIILFFIYINVLFLFDRWMHKRAKNNKNQYKNKNKTKH